VSGLQGTADSPRWTELFTRAYARTTVGLVLLETLVAVQVLVTIAVLPAVVRDLGGLRLYGVALSASALAAAVALPITARLVARWGLRLVFLTSVAVFAAGTVVVFTAPNMPVFISGRLLEGAAGGAQYALMLTIFTRRYPTRLRPRMLAVWSTAWAVPGLVGPAYGGIVASTLGWRWAFALLLPLLVPSVVLLQRDLEPSPPNRSSEAPVSARPAAPDDTAEQPEEPGESAEQGPASWPWLVTLGVGMALVLLSLALAGWPGLIVGICGLVPSVLALRVILPPGSFLAKPGLPAVIAAAFLANVAFFAADGFLPAMLTGVRGEGLTLASVVVTCGTLAWVVGTWWQSRVIGRWSAKALVLFGTVLVLLGVVGIVFGDFGAPLVIPYLAWGVAGFGMGVSYPTITLLATELAQPAEEVVTLSQYQLAESLGAAVGPGLAGGALSIALGAGLTLRGSLLAGFGVAFALGLLLLGAALRLPGLSPSGRAPASTPAPARNAPAGREPAGRPAAASSSAPTVRRPPPPS
jgi:MFS family permease